VEVRNRMKNRFWDDQWFGSYSLAIQFWEIYTIVNEQGVSIKDAWDGENVRFTFSRTVDSRLMVQWYKLIQIASGVEFSEEDVIV
jgi:hypothetical protein